MSTCEGACEAPSVEEVGENVEGVVGTGGGLSPVKEEEEVKEDFWREWGSEERAAAAGDRDSASPWQRAQPDDFYQGCQDQRHQNKRQEHEKQQEQQQLDTKQQEQQHKDQKQQEQQQQEQQHKDQKQQEQQHQEQLSRNQRFRNQKLLQQHHQKEQQIKEGSDVKKNKNDIQIENEKDHKNVEKNKWKRSQASKEKIEKNTDVKIMKEKMKEKTDKGKSEITKDKKEKDKEDKLVKVRESENDKKQLRNECDLKEKISVDRYCSDETRRREEEADKKEEARGEQRCSIMAEGGGRGRVMLGRKKVTTTTTTTTLTKVTRNGVDDPLSSRRRKEEQEEEVMQVEEERPEEEEPPPPPPAEKKKVKKSRAENGEPKKTKKKKEKEKEMEVLAEERDGEMEEDGEGAKNGMGEEEEEGEKKKKKKKKKSRSAEDEEKKTKKKKKATYQHREDILQKHVGPRVRSFDASKMKSKFEKPKQVSQVPSECRQCGKQVFQMEKIVAEKASWHKNCFRCKECNCLLTLETYQSHEGVLYCKIHFKELFRPKAVVEDEDEARRERLLRRPKMIVLESKPEDLPDDVVRSTNRPDYGLEDLSTANLKDKFKMFEKISTEEEKRPEPIPVRRSQSLLGRAAKFLNTDDDEYGIENSELGEYDEYDEDEEDDDYDEEEEEEEGEDGEKIIKKKNRPTSFSGLQDLKAGFARKNRREELSKQRREELARFRQMLCAGKNISTREVFEGGNDEEGQAKRKEQIKIEGCPAARNLRERFEKGLSINEEDLESEERREVDSVFRKAETASKARSLFKEIDTAVGEGKEPVMRTRSSAAARKENRLSRDGKRICSFTSQVFDEDSNEGENEDSSENTSSLLDRFKFFATYEERVNQEKKKPRKLFRITPPRDGEEQGIDVVEQELGRDPNLIKCTDNYEDEVDCRGTRDLLAKFRKMERQMEEKNGGPRPLKRFTPPPDGEEYDSDEEYTDEDYSDEEEDSEEDYDEEDEEDEEDDKPKYKDEVLEMLSARKAASLRAKFEKWESEVDMKNEYNEKMQDDEEECMPSIDTARNLRAMFENKAQEAAKPVVERPRPKVNRFV